MPLAPDAQDSSVDRDRAGRRVQFLPKDALGDRYRVLSLLGAGGMGEVYAVEHVQLGRRFAAKVLKREFVTEESLVVRFRREVRAMARLHSDHVARIVDMGALQDGTPFFVMDLLIGTDLKTLLRRLGSLSAGQATALARDACWGLKAVHEAGLVHRDVKPANLFVTRRDSGEDRCVLLDFGVAKSTSTEQTREGQIVGTLQYMAPEQLDGGTLDCRTDLYALGAVLYESLAGQSPHHAGTLEQTLFAIMNKTAVPLSKLRPDLPEPLCALVDRAIARDPVDRFANPDALIQALTPFVTSSDVEASNTGMSTVAMSSSLRVLPSRPTRNVRLTMLALVGLFSVLLGWTALPLFAVWRRDYATGTVDVAGQRPDSEPMALGTSVVDSTNAPRSVGSLEPTASGSRRTPGAVQAPIDSPPELLNASPRAAKVSKVQPQPTGSSTSFIDLSNPYER